MSTSENTTKDAQFKQPGASQAAKTIGMVAVAFALGGVVATVTSSRHQDAQGGGAVQVTNEKTGDAETDAGDKKNAGPQFVKFDAAAIKAADIKVETVRPSLSSESLSVPGTVMTNPNRLAKITPPVAGKVARIYAGLGDTVRAGQALVAIDSVDVAQAHAAVSQAESAMIQASAAVNTAKAQVEEARAKQSAAEATLQRQSQLAQAGAFSQGPLAAAKSEVSQAQADLAQAQAELQIRVSSASRAERLFRAQVVSHAELEQAQSELRQSQARTEQASTRVELAKQALAREQSIFGGNLLNKQAIQTAEADVRSSRAQTQTAIRQAQAADAALRGARTAVATAVANLAALEGGRHAEGGSGLIVLRAPISGTITDRQATIGEAVERSVALFQIENLNSVLVSANVPESQIGRVRAGQRARVSVLAYPDQRFSGVVVNMASRVDEKTRALPVRLLVDNSSGRLRPDMYARASLDVGQPSASIAVPPSAIDDDGSERFVYVQKPGGFEKRAVQTGATTSSAVVITEGLRAGERVVTEGAFVLKSESKKDELKGDDD